jgi:hypothetical protein
MAVSPRAFGPRTLSPRAREAYASTGNSPDVLHTAPACGHGFGVPRSPSKADDFQEFSRQYGGHHCGPLMRPMARIIPAKEPHLAGLHFLS